MDLKELKNQLDADLNKSIISSSILLGRFSLIDDSAKIIGSYFDPRYFPFYYHLGKRITPKTLLHFGFGIGLESGIFLMGCKTINSFLAFQDPLEGYYSPRIGMKNIKRVYKNQSDYIVGSIKEDLDKLKQNRWDVAIVTDIKKYDELRYCFDKIWDSINYNGLMIVDHITHEDSNRRAFEDFCKITNRDSVSVDTRYGVGIICK